jgi:adenylylsulfate kinase
MNGFTIWLTGLPASGKTTIAAALRDAIQARGCPVQLLDGDDLRRTLSRDLGFDRASRMEHVARVASLVEGTTKEGIVAIVAVIAPYRESRDRVRSRVARFMEVYVHCPLDELIRRDPKGHYRRALRGELANFTGVSDPYEPPLAPEVAVDTAAVNIDEAVAAIIREAEHLGYLNAIQRT